MVKDDDSDQYDIPLTLWNISPTGVFLRSDYLLDVGDVCALEFPSPISGDTTSVVAEVVRVCNEPVSIEDSFIPGMGLEFRNLDLHSFQEICTFTFGHA